MSQPDMQTNDDVPPIVSPKCLDDLVTRTDGTKMTIQECVATYGYRSVWVAEFHGEMRRLGHRPRLAGYPPRVFISYRWESEELKKWVRDLALLLKRKGYAVLLDQFSNITSSHLAAPKYVAQIVTCHYILIVITPGYCTVAPSDLKSDRPHPDGWVMDEQQMAASLSNSRLAQIVGLLKEGSHMPEGCGPGNTIDLRGSEDALALIDEAFPDYRGKVLSDAEQEAFVSVIESCRALLACDRVEDAERLLTQNERFTAFPEYRLLQAQLYSQTSRQAHAAQIAGSLFHTGRLEPETILYACNVLRTCGHKKAALKRLVPLSKTGFSPIQVQTLMGDILDDLGSYKAAVHHLKRALHETGDNPDILNTLGIVYRHDQQPRRAEECFRKALQVDPHHALAIENLILAVGCQGRTAEVEDLFQSAQTAHPAPSRLSGLRVAVSRAGVERPAPPAPPSADQYSCPNCRSSYSLDVRTERLCGNCGTVYGSTRLRTCPCCDNEMAVPLEWLGLTEIAREIKIGCPICRRGPIQRHKQE